MSKTLIPYGRQWIDDDDVAAVTAVLRSDFLTTGPTVEAFEAALAATCRARHAVVVNSGTAALHAAYFALGVEAGDEVLTSPLTFAATANAARYLGANVRFADIDPETGLLDVQAAARALTPRTRLVVPVDFAGAPADTQSLAAAISGSNAAIVVDAAHSLGAIRDGQAVGERGAAATLSFHPVKPITTGEGGAVVTNRADVALRAREFRTHGITREASRLEHAEGPWSYEQWTLGFNYRLTDLQCALGLSQLRKLERFLARRREIAAIYTRELAHTPGLRLPTAPDPEQSGWHLYVVRVDAGRRRAWFERLRERGIGVQVHYTPVYLHPYYRRLGFSPGLCPHAEQFAAQCFSLPIFPALTDGELDRIISAVRRTAQELESRR